MGKYRWALCKLVALTSREEPRKRRGYASSSLWWLACLPRNGSPRLRLSRFAGTNLARGFEQFLAPKGVLRHEEPCSESPCSLLASLPHLAGTGAGCLGHFRCHHRVQSRRVNPDISSQHQ